MPDPLDEQTRVRMSRQATRDTGPELEVRRLLHSNGFRYRVDTRPEEDLRTKADLLFRGPRIVVFMHGCFWHGCARHYTPPRHNASWWAGKISRNRERDAATRHQLEERGWRVLEFWEHDDPADVARQIGDLIRRKISAED